MAIIIQPLDLQDVLRHENREITRRAETLALGAVVALGAVLGRKRLACPAVGTAKVGNAGGGTLTAVTAGLLTEIGEYLITCIATAAGGGVFSVTTPSGLRLADAVVGTPYATKHLSFTVNDGDPDFALGDAFTVAVAAGSGEVVPLAPAATDGSQVACGIAAEACNATAAASTLVMIGEFAVILGENLTWPAGITSDQKAAAMRDLAVLHIQSRKGV